MENQLNKSTEMNKLSPKENYTLNRNSKSMTSINKPFIKNEDSYGIQ